MDVVVTGSTGGIGRATARLLAARGVRLFLVARNEDALTDLAEELRALGSPLVHTYACDFGKPDWLPGLMIAIQGVFEHGIAAVINSAGVGFHSRIESIEEDELEETFRVNVFAPIMLTAALLPLLRKSGRGHVVNISSILGTKTMRYTASYAASKHALEGFSKTLRMEAAPEVRVTLIEPGAVETDFLGRTHEPYAVEAFGGRRLERLQPDCVAEWVWLAMSAKPSVCPEVIRISPTEQTL